MKGFLKNYTYVFLGSRDTSKLKDVKNLLVAKNFKKNLEDYPLFTDFTGWYMLWKNNFFDLDSRKLGLKGGHYCFYFGFGCY